MTEDKRNMLSADSRFVVSFLLEESLHQGSETKAAKPVFKPTQAELSVHKNRYQAYASEAGQAFLTAAQKVIPFVNAEEFQQWSDFGIRLLDASDSNSALVIAYLDASEAVFIRTSFTYLKAWLEKGLAVAGYSVATASTYFELTPPFIRLSNNIQLQKWGDWCTHLLDRDEPESRLGKTFLEHSITCLQFMTFREFREYKNLGFMFFRLSPALGKQFFKGVVNGLGDLDISQRRTLYQLTKRISRDDMAEAFSFFRRYPQELTKISPNERNRVLAIVESITKSDPRKISGLFSNLVSALQHQPYPSQILILDECGRVIEKSPAAGIAFLLNAKKILSRIPDCFLPRFVSAGLSMDVSENAELERYFSLGSLKAHRELKKWCSASVLDDHRKTLSVLATAMTGKPTDIKDIDVLEDVVDMGPYRYATTDGKTIYLPGHMANDDSPEKNFKRYKIVTAHQAGLLEFKTFTSDLPVMVKMLSDLPQAQLALDIFFILEHGRIDFQLAQNYRGLKETIEQMVWVEINQRTLPEALPSKEAVVEILLLYSVIPFNPDYARSFKTPSKFLSPHVRFLNQTLAGFYEHNNSVWYCFEKTYDIYHYLKPLPNHKPGWAEEPYQACPPLAYRGRIYPAILQQQQQPEEDLIPDGIPELADGKEEFGELLLQDAPPDKISLVEGDVERGAGVPLPGRKDASDLAAGNRERSDESPQNFVISDASRTGPESLLMRSDGIYYYDEWDYIQKAYRKKWCCLKEIPQEEGGSEKIDQIYDAQRHLIQAVKKHFQQIKPRTYENIPRVDWGDEIDLGAVIEGVVDRKAGNMPSDKVFIRKERKRQHLSVLFLVDMSASTGNPARQKNRVGPEEPGPAPSGKAGCALPGDRHEDKKVLDAEIESLVVVTEALETLNHDYAIYGFSGYGRENVNVYAIKDFKDPHGETVKKRIGGMTAQKSTRMGTAIRHVSAKLERQASEQRLMILLSDGFPQDYDYGEDRSSYEYGIHDTMMALMEAKYKEITPFCITVDHEGKDYLKNMCEPNSYLVIHDIASLPEMLPKVVAALIQ